MTGRGFLNGWVNSWSPWTRTGLTVVGAGLVILAVSMTRAALTSLSRTDGHAAAHSAAGVMVAVVFVVLPLLLFGIAFVAIGLTVPGDTRWPSIPDVGFSPRQRRRVVLGALLQVFGPIVGAAVAVFQGRIPLIWSGLVVLPILSGWGLVAAGFGSRLVTSRLVPKRVTSRLDEARLKLTLDPTWLAKVRTVLVGVGLFAFLVGVAHVFGPSLQLIGAIEAGLLAAFGSAAFGLGTLVPGRGRGITIPPVGYSRRQAHFVGWGTTAATVAPLLGIATWNRGVSYLTSVAIDLVYFGWFLMAVGMVWYAFSRFSNRSG